MQGNGTVEQWVEKPNSTLEYYVNSLKNTSKTYGESSDACMSMGGILASVLNEQIQIFLETIIPSTGASEQSRFYWIGAQREETENSIWKWQNNESLTYSNWGDGEGLINSTMDEYCASIWATGGYKWYDNHCDGNDYGYVCQRNTEDITTMPETSSTTTTTTTTTMPSTTTTLSSTTTTTLQTTTETTTGSQAIASGFQGSIESIVVPVVAVVLAIIGLVILAYICYRSRKRFDEELDITSDEPIPTSVLEMTQINEQSNTDSPQTETTQTQTTYASIQHNNDNNTGNENPCETMPLSPTAQTSSNQQENCHIDRPHRFSVFGNSTYGMVVNESRKKKSTGRDSYMDIYSSSSKKGKNNLRKSRTKV